jgi:hypothetical protein
MQTFGDDADGAPFAPGHCIERVATLPTGVPVEKARLAWGEAAGDTTYPPTAWTGAWQAVIGSKPRPGWALGTSVDG